MKIIAFSDMHRSEKAAGAILEAAQDAELVLGAGDFCNRHTGLEEAMRWLDPIADKLIVVPGNNERPEDLRAATRATVLHGEAVTRNGLAIAGIGGGIPGLSGATWPSWDLSEAEASALLAPLGPCDILISHSPPLGACDTHVDLGPAGSAALAEALPRLAPKWLICGHIHDAWGAQTQRGPTTIRNLGPVPYEILL